MATLSALDLREIAQARLDDAKALREKNRWDGGVYLCGYAVEMALKARICQTLSWTTFPIARSTHGSFFTHNLDVLLNLSGMEGTLKPTVLAEWSIVTKWDPEVRYTAIGKATDVDLTLMIDATEELLKKLLRLRHSSNSSGTSSGKFRKKGARSPCSRLSCGTS